MTRSIYLISTALAIILAVCAVLQIASAHASVMPKADRLSIAPEKAKDEDKGTCVDQTVKRRILLYKDGRAEVTAAFTIWEPCK